MVNYVDIKSETRGVPGKDDKAGECGNMMSVPIYELAYTLTWMFVHLYNSGGLCHSSYYMKQFPKVSNVLWNVRVSV